MKIKYKDTDLRSLYKKILKLESKFKRDPGQITDERLDKYILLKKRIKELHPYQEVIDHKEFVIDNFIYLIRSLEIYLSMFEYGEYKTNNLHGIQNILEKTESLLEQFQKKG
jgi:hypothetical protein